MNELEFLHQNWLLNAPIIEAIERNEAKILSFNKYGVEALHKEGILLLSLVSDEALLNYKKQIESGILTVFYGAQDNEKILRLMPSITRMSPCRQMVYTLKTPPAIDSNADFKLLDLSYAQFVYENYGLKPQSIEHIRDLISRKLIYGAFIDGEIAGFIGRHQDGSMGLLEVMSKFRRQGIGRALEHFLIKTVLEEGRVPFGHVKIENQISFCLQNSITGAEFADKLVNWISVKK